LHNWSEQPKKPLHNLLCSHNTSRMRKDVLSRSSAAWDFIETVCLARQTVEPQKTACTT
jgi:hypothetical protein